MIQRAENHSPKDTTTACIILAGGASKRMGRNKALLPIPGRGALTFVEHLASILTSLCAEVLLVARDEGDALNYRLEDVRVVVDQVPGFGPLMGLYSGLRAIRAERALVVAVDMPSVQAELVSFLLSQLVSDALVVPVVEDVPQVLFALYPRSVLPLIEECLRQGRRDPRSLLEVSPVRYIEEGQLRKIDPELCSFVNVNTPDELRKLM